MDLINPETWQNIGIALGVAAAAIAVGLIIVGVLIRVVRKFSGRTTSVIDESIVRHCRRPVYLLVPVLTLNLVLPVIRSMTSDPLADLFVRLLRLLLTVGIAWLLIKLVSVLQDYLLNQYQLDVTDNLKARKIHTQMQLLKRVLTVVIGTLALAVILMNFEEFRQLGTGILASAGVAGIIIGFAAQKTLSNLLAGIQIAITQPVRLDDAVVVEGEWGWIEEITLTYVVVRIWDLRRLILPISYLLEKPFQNWTRSSANLLGTVYLYVDYTIPIEEIREALGRILEQSEHWDGKVWRLHVTDTNEKTVELRALMSAKDSPTTWELRCEVREKLIEYVQRNYPDGLPKVRATMERIAGAESTGQDRNTGSGTDASSVSD